MATTTNYAWDTPDDTDLVKDGAAAIRTLGSSVDTTVKALNPGTTAGDIDYYTSSTAKSRIGIGTSGQVLAVNGSNLPAWTTVSSGGMTLLSTTALSGASVSVTSISGSYTDLLIVVSRESTNGDAPLTATFNSNTGTLYQFNNTIATSMPLSRGLSIDQISSASNNFVINVSRYASATEYKPVSITAGFVNSATGGQVTYADGGSFLSNTAITSFQLATSGAGVTFDGGNIYIYGVK